MKNLTDADWKELASMIDAYRPQMEAAGCADHIKRLDAAITLKLRDHVLPIFGDLLRSLRAVMQQQVEQIDAILNEISSWQKEDQESAANETGGCVLCGKARGEHCKDGEAPDCAGIFQL